jgi:hypothetical protein
MSEYLDRTERSYHVLEVPLRTGSLYPGSENDAQAYRDVQLLPRLQAADCKAIDDGDVMIPSYLPHHAIPPIRSWPARGLPGTVSVDVSCPTCNSQGIYRC